jgi:hypothetical protein
MRLPGPPKRHGETAAGDFSIPCLHKTGIDEEAIRSGLETARITKPGLFARDVDERLLSRIFGQAPVAHHAVSVAE